MGKKILVPCLDVIMIAFFYFSIRNMVFTFRLYFRALFGTFFLKVLLE